MGIKQEIERLELAEQARRDEETRQKKQLIQKIEATEKQLWTIAEDFATPFAQKLQESGVVEILDELRKGEDLRVRAAEWQWGSLFHPHGFSRKDPRPASLETVFKVGINDQMYVLLGFDLEPNKFHPELSTKSLDQLQQHYANVTSAVNSEIRMEECFTELKWNFPSHTTGLDGYEYDRLCFSLFHRDGTYVLELTGGESFPEHSWNKKCLEQAVARAYVNHLTRVEVPEKPDMGS